MDHVLPTLIEQARARRDVESARLQQAGMAVRQAEATIARLRQFRVECLQRSAGGSLGRSDADGLKGYQQFMTRLDDALRLQDAEVVRRQEAVLAQQSRLREAQQRLLAYENLVRRRAQARDAKAMRAAQRDADEFAARAFARAAQEMTP